MGKVISTLLFFCLLANVCQAVEDNRAPRSYEVVSFENAGLGVLLPLYPAFERRFETRGEKDAILLMSPPNYYPTTHMQIQLHPKQRVSRPILAKTALSSANAIRKQLDLEPLDNADKLTYVKYGEVRGYADIFDKEDDGKVFSIKSVFGIMPTEQPITLMVSTPKGQLDHIEHVVIKIWKNLSVLPSALPPGAVLQMDY